MKQCSVCRQEKEEVEFPKKGNGRVRTHCKLCANEMGRKHYQNNKGYYFERNKKRRADVREKLVGYLLTHPCVDCGEKDLVVLDFDHEDPNQKIQGISVLARKTTWGRLTREIKKCCVRCSNCHRRRTAKQFKWYKLTTQLFSGPPCWYRCLVFETSVRRFDSYPEN